MENSQNNNLFRAYQAFWKNYFQFKAHSNRNDYWWPFMWNWLIRIGLAIVTLVGYLKNSEGTFWTGISLLIIYSLVALIPIISLTIRRYQDAGISGWWILLTCFAPYCFKAITELTITNQEGSLLANALVNACDFLEFICIVIALILPMLPSHQFKD